MTKRLFAFYRRLSEISGSNKDTKILREPMHPNTTFTDYIHEMIHVSIK